MRPCASRVAPRARCSEVVTCDVSGTHQHVATKCFGRGAGGTIRFGSALGRGAAAVRGIEHRCEAPKVGPMGIQKRVRDCVAVAPRQIHRVPIARPCTFRFDSHWRTRAGFDSTDARFRAHGETTCLPRPMGASVPRQQPNCIIKNGDTPRLMCQLCYLCSASLVCLMPSSSCSPPPPPPSPSPLLHELPRTQSSLRDPQTGRDNLCQFRQPHRSHQRKKTIDPKSLGGALFPDAHQHLELGLKHKTPVRPKES